jgi:hypothetical protein
MPLVLWPIVGNATPIASVFVAWAMCSPPPLAPSPRCLAVYLAAIYHREDTATDHTPTDHTATADTLYLVVALHPDPPPHACDQAWHGGHWSAGGGAVRRPASLSVLPRHRCDVRRACQGCALLLTVLGGLCLLAGGILFTVLVTPPHATLAHAHAPSLCAADAKRDYITASMDLDVIRPEREILPVLTSSAALGKHRLS